MISSRPGLVTILVLTVAVALLLWANDEARRMEKNAAAREQEATEVAALATELRDLEAGIAQFRQGFGGGEPLIQTAERVAAAEGLVLSSTQNAGDEATGTLRDVKTSLRLQSAPLKPLMRFLANLESSRGGLLIREFTIRKAVDRSGRLDAEVVAALLVADGDQTQGREVP